MIRARTLLPLILLSPSVALAAARTFEDLATTVVALISTATAALIVFGLVMYFWGMTTNILKFEEDPEKVKAYFFWGLVVLFVMVSIWGIVEILQNTLFSGSPFNPATGSSPLNF